MSIEVLIESAKTGDLSALKGEISKGVDINGKGCFHETALVSASYYRKIDVILELLKYPNLNINCYGDNRHTSLIYACVYNLIPIVQELVKRPDLDINMQDHGGTTALIIACSNNHLEIVKELLKRPDLDINLINNFGGSALLDACSHGHLEIVKELVKCDTTDINLVSTDGNTAFLRACRFNKKEVVYFLIEKGVVVNTINDNGDTALISICYSSYNSDRELDLLQKILEFDQIDPNHQNNAGKTALMVAYIYNHDKIYFKYLLTGSSASAQPRSRFSNFKEIGKFPSERGESSTSGKPSDPTSRINIMLKDAEGKTVLDYAVENKDFSAIKLIVNNPKFPVFETYRELNRSFVEDKETGDYSKTLVLESTAPATETIVRNVLFEVITLKISKLFMKYIKGYLVRRKYRQVLLNISNLPPNTTLYQPVAISKFKAEMLVITSLIGGSTFRRLQRKNKNKFKELTEKENCSVLFRDTSAKEPSGLIIKRIDGAMSMP